MEEFNNIIWVAFFASFAILAFVIAYVIRKKDIEMVENLDEYSLIYKKILSIIYYQFYEYETNSNYYLYSIGIREVELELDECFKVKKEPLTIKITLLKPGMIIGKAGATINEIKRKIAKELNLEENKVVINLEEFDLFRQIFK